MKKQNVTFQIIDDLVLENSFGEVCSQKNVTLEINIGWFDDDRGFFEIYDIDTGGQNWYAEGYLILDNNVLIDYDGVFELLPAIIDKLKEMGIDVTDFE